MSRLSSLAACTLLAALLSGCATPPDGADLPPEAAYSLKRYRKEYVIAPSDTLEIVVQRSPEVSRTVVVRPDGMITLPTIGDVTAAGLTFPEFDEALTRRLAARYQSPEVDVIAVDVPPAVVYVVGEVAAPRPVPLRTARTAAEALGQVGGFRVSGRREAVLIRLEEDGRLAAIRLRNENRSSTAAYLTLQGTLMQADDILLVTESGRSLFTRFIDDFINRPLSGANSILGLYVNYKLTEQLDASIDQIESIRP